MPGFKRKRSYKGRLVRSYKGRNKRRRFYKKTRNQSQDQGRSRNRVANRLTTARVPRHIVGAADRVKTKLKLHFTLSAAASVYTSCIMQINDLFDPTGATGTAQPYYFDQWAALYDVYFVHGFSVAVTPVFGATGITSTSSFRYGITPTDANSTFNTVTEALEQSRSIHRLHQINSGTPETIRAYVKPHVAIGISRMQYNGNLSRYGAAVTASPTGLAYTHIWFCPVEVASTHMMLDVVCEFYCEFMSPKIPSV